MHQYKVQYTLRDGGVMREEVVSARSNWEAQKVIESRYEPGRVLVIQVTQVN